MRKPTLAHWKHITVLIIVSLGHATVFAEGTETFATGAPLEDWLARMPVIVGSIVIVIVVDLAFFLLIPVMNRMIHQQRSGLK